MYISGHVVLVCPWFLLDVGSIYICSFECPFLSISRRIRFCTLPFFWLGSSISLSSPVTFTAADTLAHRDPRCGSHPSNATRSPVHLRNNLPITIKALKRNVPQWLLTRRFLPVDTCFAVLLASPRSRKRMTGSRKMLRKPDFAFQNRIHELCCIVSSFALVNLPRSISLSKWDLG